MVNLNLWGLFWHSQGLVEIAFYSRPPLNFFCFLVSARLWFSCYCLLLFFCVWVLCLRVYLCTTV